MTNKDMFKGMTYDSLEKQVGGKHYRNMKIQPAHFINENKLLFAVSKQTAAEIITSRADVNKDNMGLTSWKGSIVRKQDIYIAKNYLDADEIDTLNRLVVIFLETAELRVKNRIDISMDFWRENIERIIQSNDFSLLQGKGTISSKQMQSLALSQYEQFDARRKAYEAQLADKQDEEELRQLESDIKTRLRDQR